ncbi:MAG: FAD binding domain-containing protein, partial [Xanthobacteraceae bacterium]
MGCPDHRHRARQCPLHQQSGGRQGLTIRSRRRQCQKAAGRNGLKPAPFAYAKARSVAHAIELLVDDDARLLAGGQSLIATLNMRLSHPALLVDINGVGGLD